MCLSPDGQAIAHRWGAPQHAYTHLYVKDLDQDAPKKLVESEPSVRIGTQNGRPTGSAFITKGRRPPGCEAIWSVARNRGDAQPAVTLTSAEISSGMDVSGDGKRILFADSDVGM